MTNSENSHEQSSANPEPMSWRIHLAAEQPGRAAVVLVVIVLALVIVALLTVKFGSLSVILVPVSALLLFGAVAEFLLPVSYTLDADGAHVQMPFSRRDLAWGRVRRVYLRPDGIKLSPLGAGGWVESYRGVMLRTRDRATVLDRVHAWLQAAGISAEEIEER